MKNPIVIFVIVIVMAVVGFGASTLMKKDETMMKKDDTAMVDDKMTADEMTASRYIQYSKPDFDAAANSRRVLFFYASWCPTCKPADASFTQNATEFPEDVTVIRVNYNDPDTDQEEKDLAKKYKVAYQHTFVQIDGSGKEITKWNGGQLEELLSKIK